MTDKDERKDDKPKWPRVDKLDEPDVGTLAGHDFARYRSRVFRAVKADSLEHKVNRQRREYEAEDAREQRRQEGDDE